MRSSTTAAQRISCGLHGFSASTWLCTLLIFIASFALPARAQTTITPTTNTILFSGSAVQDPQNHNTNPVAGIVMQGTAISDITGRPVRYLWVADTFASICRMDPEVDAPGPWHMNAASCYFFVNSGGGAIPVAGQFAYDPARKFLYFVDNNGKSQGVIRIGFDPSADSGHGALDPSTVFTLGGGATGRKATFLGGVGCPLPTAGTQPNGAPNPKAPLGGGTRGTTKQIANTRRTHIKRRSCFLLIQGLESLIIPYKAVYASFTYLDAKKVTNEDFYALDIQPEFITSRCSPRTRKGWSSGGCLMG